MPLTASDSGGKDFEPTEAGVHHAVCYFVIDIGTQPSNNPLYADAHRCIIGWELPELRISIESDGERVDKPRVISRELTISLSEKSHMRPLLESWRGKPFNMQELLAFDLGNLIGVNCLLNVMHKESKGKTYANVATAMPLAKNMPKLKPENPTIFYSIEDDGFNFPKTIPEWIQKKIKNSIEYQNAGNPGYEEEQIGGYGEMGDAYAGDEIPENCPF